MKVQMFGFRREKLNPKWIWLGGCAKWFGYGGWIYLSPRWFYEMGVKRPFLKALKNYV